MENTTGKQQGRGRIMSAPSDEDGWMREYDDASGASHHNDLLTQQQLEERKKMAWEPRDNTGILKKNIFKTEDRHPFLKGEGLIGGTHYEFAGWKKKDKNGDTFFSMSFKLPKDKAQGYSKPAPPDDDDLGF